MQEAINRRGGQLMRLRVNIPQVDPTVVDAPEVCPYGDCDGEHFTPHQQH